MSQDAPLDLDAVCRQVVAILVDTFGYSVAESTQRVNLWRARQHGLEAQVLAGILPAMGPEEAQRELLRWMLEGEALDADLRSGARELELEIDPPD